MPAALTVLPAAAETAAETGRNSAAARCGGCPATWAGLAVAHCAACHATFGSVTGFDLHRADGACRDPRLVTRSTGQPVYELRDRTGGPVWVLARAGGHWKGAA